jgi:hypothetical protein
VPRSQVHPFQPGLPWGRCSAAYRRSCEPSTGHSPRAGPVARQRLLIRRHLSARLRRRRVAHDLGATVLATTRQLDRRTSWRRTVSTTRSSTTAPSRARSTASHRAESLPRWNWWEHPTLPDTLAATRIYAPSASPGFCLTSGRSATSTDRHLPTGVRLTAYGGGAADLPAPVLQRYLDRIADGTLSLGPSHTYDWIRSARRTARWTPTPSAGTRRPDRIRVVMRAAWYDRRAARDVLVVSDLPDPNPGSVRFVSRSMRRVATQATSGIVSAGRVFPCRVRGRSRTVTVPVSSTRSDPVSTTSVSGSMWRYGVQSYRPSGTDPPPSPCRGTISGTSDREPGFCLPP